MAKRNTIIHNDARNGNMCSLMMYLYKIIDCSYMPIDKDSNVKNNSLYMMQIYVGAGSGDKAVLSDSLVGHMI